MDKKEG
jgi:hypothetical protein